METVVVDLVALIDVDDTLYPKGRGPFALVNHNIDLYVMDMCGMDLDAARSLRRTYICSYGSTLQGLMHEHGCDPVHYLKKVHDVPVEEILKPDPRLREALGRTGCRMAAFTNGSYEYARRILKALGVDDILAEVFSIEYMDFVPKPLSWGYLKAMHLFAAEPGRCLVVDDSEANVRTALELGMHGVKVGGGLAVTTSMDGSPSLLEGASHAPSDEGRAGSRSLSISTIYEIPRVVERLGCN
ncbi:MAG TPA: pyrimidine 5'-nucleotidase [Deltaproteobacteria bacterium]|nr:pyrimidine 5'-nucleotidase [Deltaproteobacteria bacterium]HOM29184.1 pyrimidine 5'-nucleotidase [Deltaproteobacteria bacterium]HPP79697.1 pyrimidine 5'-nucleotidase [Deltaproteobacteria bacterium]